MMKLLTRCLYLVMVIGIMLLGIACPQDKPSEAVKEESQIDLRKPANETTPPRGNRPRSVGKLQQIHHEPGQVHSAPPDFNSTGCTNSSPCSFTVNVNDQGPNPNAYPIYYEIFLIEGNNRIDLDPTDTTSFVQYSSRSPVTLTTSGGTQIGSTSMTFKIIKDGPGFGGIKGGATAGKFMFDDIEVLAFTAGGGRFTTFRIYNSAFFTAGNTAVDPCTTDYSGICDNIADVP